MKKARKVVGIGETVYDIIFKNDNPISATPGGSAFNAIISLGRTKTPCCMITETGDDHIGEMTCSFLADNGIDTKYVNRRKGMKSHVSLAFLDDNNDAQYQFYKDHANDKMSTVLPEISEEDIVLFGSFYAINPVIRPFVGEILKKASETGATLYYDINFRASHINEIPDIIDNLNENIKLSSIVRGSLEDFGYLYNSNDVDDIYERHIKPYCPYFICTNGGKPVQLRTPTLSMSFPAKDIKTVSTIGAGDNFNAGFIYALINKISNEDSNDCGTEGEPAKTRIARLTEQDWSKLIKTAQSFSSDVCLSTSNSISLDFAANLVSL